MWNLAGPQSDTADHDAHIVAQRLPGGRVKALTHRIDGDPVLAGFAQASRFTVALPEEPGCNRYHPLRADLLRRGLRRQMPQRPPARHRQAATWHAPHGLAPEALHHAVAAGDRRYAATVPAEPWPGIVLCSAADAATSGATHNRPLASTGTRILWLSDLPVPVASS